jgi:hypothetical protein
MGGYRSGRRYDAKELVEECHTFPASWMLQNNYFDLGVGQKEYHSFTWRNYCNEPLYTLTADLERVAPCQMRLYLGSTRQVVYLHSTDCLFGGLRWWFNCPGCARRCAKLYGGRSSMFLCRLSRSYLSELHRGEINSGLLGHDGCVTWSERVRGKEGDCGRHPSA